MGSSCVSRQRIGQYERYLLVRLSPSTCERRHRQRWQIERSNLLRRCRRRSRNGRRWVHEQRIECPAVGPIGARRCPRRVGIVSTGLITRRSEAWGHLEDLRYDLDSHRRCRPNAARRDETRGLTQAAPACRAQRPPGVPPRPVGSILDDIQPGPVEALQRLEDLRGVGDNDHDERVGMDRVGGGVCDHGVADRPAPGDRRRAASCSGGSRVNQRGCRIGPDQGRRRLEVAGVGPRSGDRRALSSSSWVGGRPVRMAWTSWRMSSMASARRSLWSEAPIENGPGERRHSNWLRMP